MSAALELQSVQVSLGARTVVQDASLRLEAGRLVAILGPNGAGKTTLLKAIAGLVPAEGAVLINGVPQASLSRAERARRISYLPQGHQIHWPLSARDVVALGRYPHGLADPRAMSVSHATVVTAAMERTGTAPFAAQSIMTLSGGERARVMLARVLAVEAPILLADEPTAALDPRHQMSVMQDLKAESRRGTLVIAVTHDIALASRMADAIVLIHEGRIVATGAPRDVLTDARLRDVYGVTALRPQLGAEAAILPWGLA